MEYKKHTASLTDKAGVSFNLPVIGCHFYCQKVVGDEKFSIKEWNEALATCKQLNLSEEETNKILFPEPIQCKEQCFECMAIVGARRRKTIEIIERGRKNGFR